MAPGLLRTTNDHRPLWLAALVLVVVCSASDGLAADPTAEQQYWLEVTNRMRRDPAAELGILVNFSAPGVWDTPRSDDATVATALNFYNVSASTLATQWGTLTAAPPLAWNSSLNASASTYSDLMVNLDQQAHGLDGLSLSQRVSAGGYSNFLELGESLFANTQSVFHGHAALAIDWGPDGGSGTGIQPGAGHRATMMDSLLKEIGIGYQTIPVPGANSAVEGPAVVTQHFGSQYRFDGAQFFADAILTGVVFQDLVLMDNFYTPGEGMAAQQVNIYNDATNALLLAGLTNSAGGFNISLTGLVDGVTYRVEAPGSGQAAQTFTLNSHIENYGADVTFYDNVYAAFVAVPEPGSALLILLAGLAGFRRRRS